MITYIAYGHVSHLLFQTGNGSLAVLSMMDSWGTGDTTSWYIERLDVAMTQGRIGFKHMGEPAIVTNMGATVLI